MIAGKALSTASGMLGARAYRTLRTAISSPVSPATILVIIAAGATGSNTAGWLTASSWAAGDGYLEITTRTVRHTIAATVSDMACRFTGKSDVRGGRP